MEPTYFSSPGEWRAWLARHHASATEIWVGFHRVSSGKPTLTWPQSVDEALCFGWIDGIRKRVDDERYAIRFTRRKVTSTWSAVNIRRVAELEAEGRMHDAGRQAFAARREDRSSIYSYERRPAALPTAHESAFRKQPRAWQFFEAQAPSYRRTAIAWVMGAKQEATRERRRAQLIECSREGRRLDQFTRTPATKKPAKG